MVSPELGYLETIEDPEQLYRACMKLYIDQIVQFETWDDYRAWLNESLERRFNPNYLPEQLLEIFRTRIRDSFFGKFKFLRKYNPHYPEYSQLIQECRSYETFPLASREEKLKMNVELFDLTINDLYYPNLRRLINCHSALHSLVMFLLMKDTRSYVNQQAVLHMEPLLTYPGDREYTLYYSRLYHFPIIIIKLQMNLAWLMEVNGNPSRFTRWCTRYFKIFPSKIFLKTFFYPWEYKLTKDQLLAYCGKYNIKYLKSMNRKRIIALIKEQIQQKGLSGMQLSAPGKTRYELDDTKYPFFKWNNITKEWAMGDILMNEVPEYTFNNKQKDWQPTGQKVQANNIIQLVAIAKYQSTERQYMNPNISLHTIADPKIHFFIYEYHPIYAINDTPAETMNKIVEEFSNKLKQQGQLGIAKNPYELQYGLSITKETRFGCIICPNKPKRYYERLKESGQFNFWYCRLIELMGSVRRLAGNVQGKSLEEIERMVYRYYREWGEM
jgi:3'-phosphoadenosine 5'-phosphosulfate sulfotransferase (PAPS reductase)/FAD synthetase